MRASPGSGRLAPGVAEALVEHLEQIAAPGHHTLNGEDTEADGDVERVLRLVGDLGGHAHGSHATRGPVGVA